MKRNFLAIFSTLLKVFALVGALFYLGVDIWILFSITGNKGFWIFLSSLSGLFFFVLFYAVSELFDAVMRIEELTEKNLETLRELRDRV
jgi:amino acid permease